MEVRGSLAEMLREAVRDVHPNETFERTLGRIVRNHEGTFRDYIELIEKVRDRARTDKTPLRDAANALAKDL